jgi:cell wall assembly regulator SMI1
MTIYSSWLKAKNELSKHVALERTFQAPATDNDIGRLISFIQNEIPEEFLNLYRINNGQKKETEFINFNRLLSIEEILASQHMLNDVLSDFDEIEWLEPDKIKNLVWSPNWIKFTDFGDDGFVLDLDPGPNGIYGQIFYRRHDDNSIEVLADSIHDFIEKISTLVESGRFEIDQGGIIIEQLY